MNIEKELKNAAKVLADFQDLKARFMTLAKEPDTLPFYAKRALVYSPSAVTPLWLFNVIEKMAITERNEKLPLTGLGHGK